MEVDKVEPRREGLQGKLETPPHDVGEEPEIAPTSPILPVPRDTSPAKPATPPPSNDGNEEPEVSLDIPVTGDEEISIESSMELESQKPETTISSPDPSTFDNTSSVSPATSAAPAPSKDSYEDPEPLASDRMVRDKATGLWISLEFEPREPI
jgi:hypothetical protein